MNVNICTYYKVQLKLFTKVFFRNYKLEVNKTLEEVIRIKVICQLNRFLYLELLISNTICMCN